MATPVRLATLADLAVRGHGLRAICSVCRRDVMLDLKQLVRDGHGPRHVVGLPLRCSAYGAVGQRQLRVPIDAWPTHRRGASE